MAHRPSSIVLDAPPDADAPRHLARALSGTSVPRRDGLSKVTGRALYTDDIVVRASRRTRFRSSDRYRQMSLEAGNRVLDAAIEVARRAGVDAEPDLVEVESHHPSVGVVDAAARWPPDLIVMGTHGRTGLMHLLLGSVAEGVVRDAFVPVLLVRGTPVAGAHRAAGETRVAGST